MVLGAAGEEIRRRQPAVREACPVGAAADDRAHRLEPDPAHGLLGRLDHLRMAVDHLVHVPVLLLLAHVDRSPRFPLAHRGEPPHQREVLLDLRQVVVADDQLDHRLLGAARDLVGCTNPSRSSVVSGESESRGSAATKSAASLIAFTSCPLAVPGCVERPRIVTTTFAALNVSASISPGVGAVERVRVPGAEALEVEVLRAARDLLVGGEADADRRVLAAGIRFR